jgi:hypothetical protein
MTETEWQSCKDPLAMLAFVRSQDKSSRRKLRLFAAACCRKTLCCPEDEQAVTVGERYADGCATEVERRVLFETTELLKREAVDRQEFEEAAHLWMRQGSITEDLWRCVYGLARPLPDACQVLRDIFPFRPIHIEPSLLTTTVLALAQSAYEERHMPSGILDNQKLAVLADAIEENGCADEALLNHLREPQAVHVRGCWAVDLVLGKT